MAAVLEALVVEAGVAFVIAGALAAFARKYLTPSATEVATERTTAE
ncbi:MAG: hypothetical protein ACRDRL_06315 [Sciscionella sp.]